MKVTKYERDAIIVITGKQLFFVHSVKLSSIINDPFQVQELSVCFKTNSDNVILENQQENEVIVYSHFYHPVQKRLHVELDVSVSSFTDVFVIIRSSVEQNSSNNYNTNVIVTNAGLFLFVKLVLCVLVLTDQHTESKRQAIGSTGTQSSSRVWSHDISSRNVSKSLI